MPNTKTLTTPNINNLSKREKNKIEKFQRISSAARILFEEKGYQNATIRDISKKAGVALGTLFLYAKDKRDLLFLLFEDELNNVTDIAFGTVKPKQQFVDQLVNSFRVFFEYFAKSPKLSRDMMREIVFYVRTDEHNSFHAGIIRTHNQLSNFIKQAQDLGLVNDQYKPADLANLIFSIYRMDIRNCFSKEDINIEDGLSKLKNNLNVLFNGISPQKNI